MIRVIKYGFQYKISIIRFRIIFQVLLSEKQFFELEKKKKKTLIDF